MTRAFFKTSLIASAVFLAACSSDDNKSSQEDIQPSLSGVAVHTVASDYVSGQQVVLIDQNSLTITQTGIGLTPVKTDYTIKTYQDDLYHIGRYNTDTIEKFAGEDMGNSVYRFSTQQAGEEASGNPYDMVFLNEEKAFVIRYGADEILVVNPSATEQSDFITGTIDISAYNTDQGNPTAADGLIHDGKLYVVMQRLDASWVAQTAYVAVFDVQTGAEIETNANAEDGLKGIPLAGLNPVQDSLTLYGEQLFITTNAPSGTTDLSLSKIEILDLNTYQVSQLLNAADISGNSGNVLVESVIVSDEQAYVYASGGWPSVSSLYQFNPTTGEIVQSDIANTAVLSEGISDIALDAEQRLWVAVSAGTAPGVEVYLVEDNSLLENRITTELPPARIEFFY